MNMCVLVMFLYFDSKTLSIYLFLGTLRKLTRIITKMCLKLIAGNNNLIQWPQGDVVVILKG